MVLEIEQMMGKSCETGRGKIGEVFRTEQDQAVFAECTKGMEYQASVTSICCPVPGIPPGLNMSGAAMYDSNILAELARLGVRCEIIFPEGRNLGCERVEGWCLHSLRTPGLPGPLQHLAWIAALGQVIHKIYREEEFHLLRVHSFLSSCLETLWILRMCRIRIPVVIHFHHLDGSAWRNRIVGDAVHRSNSVICFSEAARKDLLARFQIEPSRVHVVYHGVERRFRPLASNVGLRRQLNIEADDKVLLFLGNLEPRKNPLMLLDVVRNLLGRGQKVKLMLCGKGPLLSKVQAKVNQLGLGGFVVLTGPIPEESKPEYYNMADVFVFPSELEGFGLVLAEAMSCGKPVVSFNNSSIPEVVEDSVTGFLVKTGDKDEFVKKTQLLLEDEHLRCRMACQAVERVERMFRWERAARETLDIYVKSMEEFKAKVKMELDQ